MLPVSRASGAYPLARLGVAAVLACAAIVAVAPLPAAGQPPPDHDQEQDGRLGGGKGDYICYSRHGFLEVWRYDPVLRRGVLLMRIPLSGPGGVDRLHQQGDGMMVGEGPGRLYITRWGDQIVVTGLFNGNNPFGPNSHTLRARDVLGEGHKPFRNRDEKIDAFLDETIRLLTSDGQAQQKDLVSLEEASLSVLDALLQAAAETGLPRPPAGDPAATGGQLSVEVEALRGRLGDLARRLAERAARAAEKAREAAELAGDDPGKQGKVKVIELFAEEQKKRLDEAIALLTRQSNEDAYMRAIDEGMEILYGGLLPLPSNPSFDQ